MHGGPAGGELNGGRSSPSCPCQLTTKGRRSRRPRPVAGGAATAAAAAAGAALLLILVVATMLVGPCDATSVRGAPPRRFTFLKRLRPRLRPTFRRIKSQRHVVSTPPTPATSPEEEEAHHLQRQQQQTAVQPPGVGGMSLPQLLRLRGVGIPLVGGGPAQQPPVRERVESYDEFHAACASLLGNSGKGQKAPKRVLSRLSVVGETGAHPHKREHVVARLLYDRVRVGSRPGQRTDGARIGLAIEGGGMRGAVSAGAAAALNLLGLSDAFDAVYGSSAGALIAAFFISRQLNGTCIYSDVIPRAGKRFLDRSQLLPAMGLLPTLGKSGAKPVLNLEFLLDDVVRNEVPLDWEAFWRHNAQQPLNIVASGLHSMQSLALRSDAGHFDSLEGLLTCLKSSMCVPGVAGPPVRLNVTCGQTHQEKEEVLADALIFEPIPFRSAVEDGCTHVVTLRTRPDGAEVLGHKVTGIYERFVAKRYLTDLHDFAEAALHMVRLDHLRQYAADLLLLNEGARSRAEGVYVPDGKGKGRRVHLLPVAPPAGTEEVETLDSSKEALCRGLKDGFAAAWDALAPEGVADEYPGMAIASELFDVADVQGFDEAWQRYSALFAPLLAPQEEGQGLEQAAA